MPQEVTLRGEDYTFTCYGVHEAKELGLIGSRKKPGTHLAIATDFHQGDGKILKNLLSGIPDAICVSSKRGISVYRPRERLKEIEEEIMPEIKKPYQSQPMSSGHGSSACEGIEGQEALDGFKDVRLACDRYLGPSEIKFNQHFRFGKERE